MVMLLCRPMDIYAAKRAIDADFCLSPQEKYEEKVELSALIKDPIARAKALAADARALQRALDKLRKHGRR